MQRRWLLSWLIGHEIGHSILHETFFEANASTGRPSPVTAAMETQADRFFAEHVPTSERDHATFVLTDFAFQVFSLAYQQGRNGSGYAVIAPSADGIHPPWLLRALAVARTVSELKSGVGSGDDFYGSLAKRILVARDGTDIGSVCEAVNLRSQATLKMRRSQQDGAASGSISARGAMPAK